MIGKLIFIFLYDFVAATDTVFNQGVATGPWNSSVIRNDFKYLLKIFIGIGFNSTYCFLSPTNSPAANQYPCLGKPNQRK